MDILTAFKNEASKLQKQLDTVHAAIKVLGGNNGAAGAKRRPLSRSARARIAKAQRCAVGQSKGREERLTTFRRSGFDQPPPMHAWNL